jgi:hypothetical protein
MFDSTNLIRGYRWQALYRPNTFVVNVPGGTTVNLMRSWLEGGFSLSARLAPVEK